MKSSRMSPNKRDSVICNVRYQPNNLGSRGFPAVFSKKPQIIHMLILIQEKYNQTKNDNIIIFPS
jgi:hypothetical protein